MKIKLLLLLCCGLWSSCNSYDYCPVTPSESDLVFTGLARSWDEAMPLGNATVGALVWQRDSTLRLSLDRTDLWTHRGPPGAFPARGRGRWRWTPDRAAPADAMQDQA